MNVVFMGTGAADFSPLLKTEYKDKLGIDARRSSSILINGQYLVDCGPHVMESFRIQQIDSTKVTDLFVTHFHSDHYDHDVVAQLAAQTNEPLHIWHRRGAKPEPIPNVVFHGISPLKEKKVRGMKVKALAANHTKWPLHYEFEVDGKRLFYGCDGAWVLNETFYAMIRREYDCMIMDATVGDYEGDYRLGEHNSIPMIRLMTTSFRTQKVISHRGVLCLSHIAPTLHKSHEETVKLLEKEGYLIAQDGLHLEIE